MTVQQEAVTSANSKLDLEALSGSYVITKDKCEEQEQDVLTDSKSLNDLLSVGPAERKELVDNAKLVALSLKTAIQENDLDISIISDSDVEYSEKMHEIDTATYNKDRRLV